MKRYILTLAAMAALCAQAQDKLDAPGRMALDYYRAGLTQAPAARLSAPVIMPFEISNSTSRSAADDVAIFITLADGHTSDEIEHLVGEITAEAGGVVLATISLDAIDELDASEAVAALSFGSQRRPMLDKAREAVQVGYVHAGTADLPAAYRGDGVICGIYDVGIDVNHPNFLVNIEDEWFPRATRLWYFSKSNGTCSSYMTPSTISSFTTDDKNDTHGTHTLGCMAGSFDLTGGTVATMGISGNVTVSTTRAMPYYGMAPGAELAVSCGQLYDSNIVNGVKKITEYAHSVGLPAVINLSVGSNIGPHDGTDSFSRMLSAYTDKAIICVSAGNEGDLPLSIIHNFSDEAPSVGTLLSSTKSHSGIIDIWGSDDQPFTLTVVVFKKSTGETVFSHDFEVNRNTNYYVTTSNYTDNSYVHDANFDKAFKSSSVQIRTSANRTTNNRMEAYVQYDIAYNTTSNSSRDLVLGFRLSGQNGKRVDLVHYASEGDAVLSSFGAEGWTDGNADLSINDMGCLENLIVVGAWNTRQRWGTLSRNGYQYPGAENMVGRISPFSSYGTLVDGRTLPTVCAPGQGLISSYNSYYTAQLGASYTNDMCAKYTYNNRTYYWEIEQGTSMSCPVTAGIIALWLQADPTLTVTDVKDIIANTSDTDNYVNDSVRWGAGKINALNGIKYVLSRSGVGNIVADATASPYVVTPLNGARWEVFCTGARTVSACVYALDGTCIATANAQGDTLDLDLSQLAHGIYLLSVDGGRYSTRIALK